MSLAERLQRISPQPGPAECKTCYWLKQQSAKDQAAFWAWVDEGLSAAQLRRECLPDGLDVGESSFRRHVADPKCRQLHSLKLKAQAS